MSVDAESPEALALKQKIDDQGNKVRDLKTAGGDKADVDAAVQALLKLKADYKELIGIDLAGGGGKKSKKEKAAKGESQQAQASNQPQQKKAKQHQQAAQKDSTKPAAQKESTQPATTSPPVVQTPSGDQSQATMTSVLTRLAQRATQSDQLIAHLRTQLASVRKSAALQACQAEEERLRAENDYLKQEVQKLKQRLIRAEVNNGVPQIPLPPKGSSTAVSTPAAVAKPTPVSTKDTTVSQPPTKQQEQGEKKNKKQEKKENKPKSAAGGGGQATTDRVDISRIDMRIGQIVGVKPHPDAESLYLEEVDLGEGKNRTILSGLVKHVPIEQMQDRIAIFMCNLKPAKMRGIFSEGMIMCGSTPEKVEIIEPPAGVKVGDKVYVEGYEGTPDAQLNPKKKIFEQVQPDLRISPEGVATYKGVPWKVKGTEGLSTVPTMRDTPIK